MSVSSVLASDDPVGQAIARSHPRPGARSGPYPRRAGPRQSYIVQLALALEEKTGQAIDEADLRLDQTVEQVRQVVARAPSLDAPAEGNASGSEHVGVEAPEWPYTWGRAFRPLALPFELIFRYAVGDMVILSGERLANLPPHVVVAGTHHGFADMLLVRNALRRTPSPGPSPTAW